MIVIYNLLYAILLPFFLFFGLMFSRKVRRFIFNKESNLNPQRNKTYWIHVSSGEFEHAKPVLRELKNKEPLTRIVVTYSSPSYLKAIKAAKEVDFYTPFKLDLRAPVSQLIRTINPKALLISRTDLWPELLDQLKRKKIPSMVFARHESGRSSFLKKLTYPLTYQKLSHLSFVDNTDLESYKKIATPKSYSVDGDPRVDEVFYKQEVLDLKNISPFQDSLILGSTWAEDIKNIHKPIIELLKIGQLKKLIIAPHEPTAYNISALQKLFKELKPSLLTQDNECESRVIIVDEIGHLFKLYPRCEIAFVGGSFKKKVHSVLEPLSFGLPVLVGPHYQNSSEAKKFSNNDFFASCENADEFKKSLTGLLKKRPDKDLIIRKVRHNHHQDHHYQKISQAVLQNLNQLLQDSAHV